MKRATTECHSKPWQPPAAAQLALDFCSFASPFGSTAMENSGMAAVAVSLRLQRASFCLDAARRSWQHPTIKAAPTLWRSLAALSWVARGHGLRDQLLLSRRIAWVVKLSLRGFGARCVCKTNEALQTAIKPRRCKQASIDRYGTVAIRPSPGPKRGLRSQKNRVVPRFLFFFAVYFSQQNEGCPEKIGLCTAKAGGHRRARRSCPR